MQRTESRAPLFKAVALLCAALLGTGRAADGQGGAAAPPRPDDAAVKAALDDLQRGGLDECRRAVLTLGRATDDYELVAALARYGVTTEYWDLTILVGEQLGKASSDVVLRQLDKLRKKVKKNPKALRRLVLMTQRVPGPGARELLLKYIKSKQTEVAITALRAVGQRKETEARGQMIALLKSKRSAIAAAAAYALVELPPDKDTVEALFKRVVAGGERRVGDACAIALQRIEEDSDLGERALALIQKRGSMDSIHGLTKVALHHAKRPHVDSLLKLIQSPNRTTREIGCDLAGLSKLPRDLLKPLQKPVYALANADQNWRVRVAAWLSLWRIGVSEIEGPLRGNIGKKGEPSYWAIQCAARHPSPSFMGPLRQAAVDTKDNARRILARRALRGAGRVEETRQWLFDVYVKGKGNKRSEFALDAIGELKDVPSFELLVDLLGKSSTKRQKLRIVKALERLTGHYFEPDPEIWREWFEVVGGKVAFDPQPVNRVKDRSRVKKNREFGITPRTEKAVELGLRWLSLHQDLSGGWNGSTFHDHCPRGECRADGGHRDRPMAYTALSLLAFQGAGYSHKTGPYRNVCERGYEYILTQQEYDGSGNEKSWTFSYEAAILCQCLSDGLAISGDPWLEYAAQRAIDYMIKIQYPGGNWRYHVRSRETDSSVMSWVLTGMISARHAGLEIPPQIFVFAEAWLDLAGDPLPPDTFEVFLRARFDAKNTYHIDIAKDKKGKWRTYKLRTWYQPPRLYTPAMSAIGVLCRIWLGWSRAHPFCIGCANTVVSKIPGYGVGLEKEYAFYPYTWYYGSLAMYQMGGRYWTRWREKCLAAIVKNQHRSGHLEGAWSMPQSQFFGGLTGGRIYCTVMCILSLESYYRYAPYLARFDVRSRNRKLEAERAREDIPPPK